MRILSQAPTRISLFGGGTDIEPYANQYGGVVLNMAINIRQHITITDDFEGSRYGDMPIGATVEFYKAFGIDGLHIDSAFDGPIESGLGSSASCAVALLGAVNRYRGINMLKEDVASKAWDIEVNRLHMFGGKQDQYASALGGVNVFEFGEMVKVNRLQDSFLDKLKPSMLLFYLGVNRKSAKIQEAFKDPTAKQIYALDRIKVITLQGIQAIGEGNVKLTGQLLDKVWQQKKNSNGQATNNMIDGVYNLGMSLGAYGGKVLGAGGGGHILFIVPPQKQKKFIDGIGLKHIDWSIDYNGLETRII